MTDVDYKSLLVEIAGRQKTIQSELAGLASAQAAALEKYENSDKVYREQLERYDKEQTAGAAGRKLATAIRLLAVFLLAFIAYRVAP